MRVIREVQGPIIKDFFYCLRKSTDKTQWELLSRAKSTLTGSGKAAMALVFKFFRSTEVIKDKTDSVLMPKWVGYWVYNQVNEFACPVFSARENTRVIVPYHQYGFPQKMKQIQQYADSIGAVIVEDCAHALWMDRSMVPGECEKNFRIYSFSKYFFCFALGSVVSTNQKFNIFANHEINNASHGITLYNNMIKYLHEMYLSECLPNTELWNNLLAMSYALYGKGFRPGRLATRLMEAKIDAEISLRKSRYAYFKEQFRIMEIERYLGECDVAPYVIPLLLPLSKLKDIERSLRSEKYKTGIYKFDVNRNILNPKFENVLWVLVHGGMSESDYLKQLEIIKRGL